MGQRRLDDDDDDVDDYDGQQTHEKATYQHTGGGDDVGEFWDA
jgi:hypothetical protein